SDCGSGATGLTALTLRMPEALASGTSANFWKATAMSLANDMANLRRDIDAIHQARKEMTDQLHRFRSDLGKTMEKNMREVRSSLARESDRARETRREFIDNSREAVKEIRDTAS